MHSYAQVEILLVEDNPNDAELTLYSLRSINLANQVLWLKDGVEALEYLFCEGQWADRPAHSLPRLILLDLKLPRVDGIGVLQKLKADPELAMIPVVMLTSSAEENDLVASYRLGVNSYIVKPVDYDVFVETVAKVGFYWMLMNKEAPPGGDA